MPPTPLERFATDLDSLLVETFSTVTGHYLDRGTSLFETLDTISAAEASIPIGGRCATLAAQVNHIRFFIDVLEQYMLGEPASTIDWAASWQVTVVSEAEWASLIQRLDAAFQRVRATMAGFTTWDGEDRIGGAMAILAHTAYHLGEIRQALCTIEA